MKIEAYLVLAYLLSLALWVVMFFVFNFKTIRQLRKNPATKEAMRMFYSYSGGFRYPSISVATRFALPKNWIKRVALFASDIDILYQHTSRLDKLLGVLVFWIMTVDIIIFASAIYFLGEQ